MSGDRGDHPSREVLERFLLAQLPASEGSRVLRHLLAGCPGCQETAGEMWQHAPGAQRQPAVLDAELELRYDEVLDRVFKRVEIAERSIARERATARELLATLEKHPIERQRMLLRNSQRFRSPALCEQLIEASHHAGFADPGRARELAEIALELVSSLDSEDALGLSAIQNLESRAWAQLANARRVSGDLAGAEEAFERADRSLCRDGAGLFEEARLCDLKASLRKEQRRFPEALCLHDRVIAIYQSLGQRHLLGRAYTQKAMVINEIGDYDSAIALLRSALELLDPKEEPRVFLVARHNLIWSLCESERYREAFALLFHTRPYYLQGGDRMNLLRMRWLEGNVSAGLGRAEQAEVAYREVGQAFGELGLDYDGALVALDLAILYARQGRAPEVRRIAREILDVFNARGIHREAIAAIALLYQAAEREQARVTLVRRVSSFLKRARSDHEIRFQLEDDAS
ncbi:MAG TPA: hypothetical protein VN783_07985 [Thermoanaerobaculia bacterium]|nr:hypothetical protein [Thermoanaerobaculia bacterium]